VRGVIIRTWERPPSIYELQGSRAVLVSGKPFGLVDLSSADAELVALPAGSYSAEDGRAYLKAVWATYGRGSRLRAEFF